MEKIWEWEGLLQSPPNTAPPNSTDYPSLTNTKQKRRKCGERPKLEIDYMCRTKAKPALSPRQDKQTRFSSAENSSCSGEPNKVANQKGWNWHHPLEQIIKHAVPFLPSNDRASISVSYLLPLFLHPLAISPSRIFERCTEQCTKGRFPHSNRVRPSG